MLPACLEDNGGDGLAETSHGAVEASARLVILGLIKPVARMRALIMMLFHQSVEAAYCSSPSSSRKTPNAYLLIESLGASNAGSHLLQQRGLKPKECGPQEVQLPLFLPTTPSMTDRRSRR